MPDVPKPNGLRAPLNSTYCFPQRFSRNLVGEKLKVFVLCFLLFFFFNTSFKNTREACKRELRLQKIRRGYWMFLKEGDDLAP